MSKKDIYKKHKNGEYFKNGKLCVVGKWLKRYMLTKTTKIKHNKYNVFKNYKIAEEKEAESWRDIVCDSANHNVSGSFYTDKYNNLYEGYPC